MDISRITSELLDLRGNVISELSERGIASQVHYTAVEIVPDTYGVWVYGIPNAVDAQKIRTVLRRMCPTWKHWPATIKDFGEDQGYTVLIERDHEPSVRQWEPPDSRSQFQ